MNRLLRWFTYAHLPGNLQTESRLCAELAGKIDQLLPESAEKTAGLRKLLEAKDCFVRGKIEALENGMSDIDQTNVSEKDAADGLSRL